MKAILDASQLVDDGRLYRNHPPALMPAGDRPFVQFALEAAVDCGAREIQVLLLASPAAPLIEALLGDGARWGVRLSCVRQMDLARALAGIAEEEPVLLASAGRIPSFAAPAAPSWLVLERNFHSHRLDATGWARLSGAQASAFLEDRATGRGWRPSLEAGIEVHICEESPIASSSPRDVIQANRALLDGTHPGFEPDALQRQPGVWVAPGARIHKTARLHAPLFIGPDAWIGRDCEIGPGTILSGDSVVERGTSVRGSVVLPDTYLGPGLEIADSIVAQGVVSNLRLDVEIEIAESAIAGRLKEPLFRWPRLLAAR